MYRTDANTFTEIYGKLKAADTQENADFIIKSKRTYQEGVACSICKKTGLNWLKVDCVKIRLGVILACKRISYSSFTFQSKIQLNFKFKN